MPGELTQRIMSTALTVRHFQHLLTRELHPEFKVPLRRRMWAWRHGYLSISAVRFGVTDQNLNDYVSDFARYVRTPRINGEFAYALNNKLIFSELARGYGIRVPENYCLITGGRFIQVGDTYGMRSPEEAVESCLSGGHFVMKPYGGGSGIGVSVLRSDNGTLLLNEKESSRDDVLRHLRSLKEMTICEFIYQHEYSSRFFPGSTNSFRVMTMWDYSKNETFIPFTAHRFGRPSSAPADNCTLGGLSAYINEKTGVLGLAHGQHSAAELVEHRIHPDTKEPIDGVQIPHWELLTSKLLEASRRMSYIPYIGWDVVVTEDGFAIIEANNYPGLEGQYYVPMAKDPRARAFYKKHKVI